MANVKRGSLTRWLAPVLCLGAVAFALMVVWQRSGVPDAAGPSGVMERAILGAKDAFSSAKESSPETFLDDLSGGRESGADGVTATIWKVPQDLPIAVRPVLDAYQEQGHAWVVTSGYLDLKGNVWGGLIKDAGGWVDMVYVTTDEEGKESCVRIARMTPCEGEGCDG